MDKELLERLKKLSTPHLADACLRVHVLVRCAPGDLQAIDVSMHMAGRVCPARHTGSVDIFLEAMEGANPGDILVVDDGGRHDRSCVGDMITREAKAAGLSGIVIWGCHRDTCELMEIGLPFFSQGKVPTGPLSAEPHPADALEWARVGDWVVSPDDVCAGDCDGVIFLPGDKLADIICAAEAIRDTEKHQADLHEKGQTLREQLKFSEYLRKHAEDPAFGFREHLRSIGGAVEE
ncbi:MAG: RraA family protein [Lachnospiraceae bacterium]|nr:RraA family protein [Lachnospiraceae bacterium]